MAFTGDDGITLDLDKHGNSRSWAGKTWDALLALDDYARISVTEGFAGDVTAYLADTPAACRTFSGNRHASTESGDVQRNPQLRAPRELPVPAEIDSSERTFMGAHFKISQSATISPRMHYLDATADAGDLRRLHRSPPTTVDVVTGGCGSVQRTVVSGLTRRAEVRPDGHCE